MKTDSLFYRLFQSAPTIFFELIGQSPAQAQGYVFRSVELKQTAFRIDGVFLPPQDVPNPIAYFVEVQFQKDEQLYRRLFAEVFLFLNQNPQIVDWRAVALYPTRSQEPTDTQPYRVLLNSPQVQRIYLDELGDIQELSVEVGLVRLIVEPEEQAVAQAKQLLARVQQTESVSLSQEAIIELIETIVVYKFPQLSRQEIAAMFGLSELKQTRVYQEALEEGRQREGVALVLRQLNRRVGVMSRELQAKVEALSLEQVEALAEALLDFSGVEELVSWLDRQDEHPPVA
ncbi:Rpn family recombination-promoting nuclease/putative transposase [Coleofasciculus sp. E1-EBD-02]|uniref:Rpn family recombination-promoting nuclease/putative transposase n=1 Tax=Coleofasciculus sp. E1-EBD-02 TaxID=3068481 RepID=UPI0032FE735A